MFRRVTYLSSEKLITRKLHPCNLYVYIAFTSYWSLFLTSVPGVGDIAVNNFQPTYFREVHPVVKKEVCLYAVPDTLLSV